MERDEKKIEDFIDKLMSSEALEQPSLDFTDKVMAEVEIISNSTATVYKPLIPKSVWWLIAAGFITLFGYVLFNKSSNTTSFLDRFNLPEVSLNLFEGFSIDYSSTLMYATVVLAIMVGIQIPLLKQYFNPKLSF